MVVRTPEGPAILRTVSCRFVPLVGAEGFGAEGYEPDGRDVEGSGLAQRPPGR